MKRIGFIFLNHLHHVLHGAPTAFELSFQDDAEVTLLTSYRRCVELLQEIGDLYPGHRCRTEVIRPARSSEIFSSLKSRPFPRASHVVRKNLDYLNTFDALASPERLAAYHFERHSGPRPKYVYTAHGAGDRAYGFNEQLTRFDLLLLSGEKVRRRMEAANILEQVDWSIIGYPKFDIVKRRGTPSLELFPEDRPIALYSPHFVPELSSWPEWGLKVLEAFRESDRYNLIFAPHVMLFSKRDPRREIPAEYFDAPNIHLDPGSMSSVDMSYTMLADTYIGDVSSQVYEFLLEPRPCVFLNPHRVAWQNDPNYAHWHLGRVVEDWSEFGPLLETEPSLDPAIRARQIAAFDDTFDLVSNVPSGRRAAEAIMRLLG